MLAVGIILLIVLAISFYSEIHALGLWFVLMIAHDFIAGLVGGSAQHMPMYAGLIIVVIIAGRRKWTGISTGLLFLVIPLLIFMTAAAIAGLEPNRSLLRVFLYSKGIVLAILVAGTVKRDIEVQCLTRYCLAGVLIAVCVTFFESFTGAYVIEGAEVKRAGMFTGDPNDTATLILMGLPLALYWATHAERSVSRIANYLLIVLIVGAVTMTQSRGGFVALILVLTILYFKKPSMKASVFALVILAAGLLFVPPDSFYWKRLGNLVGEQEIQEGSVDKRKHYVEAGVEVFLEEPVLGVGIGNFGRAVVAIDPTYRERDITRVAHNMYLEFFVENGVFGGLLFLALLGSAVLHSWRYDRRNKSEYSAYGLGFCVVMSLAALLFSGLFLSIGKSAELWFLVGLGFAFQAMSKAAGKSEVSQHVGRLTDY